MNRQLFITQDGSHTVRLEQEQLTFHSVYGAIHESQHVYIRAGLESILQKYESLHIFEMGFGTGLNAWLTLLEADKKKINIEYLGMEAYPLEDSLISGINYPELPESSKHKGAFEQMHASPWEQTIALTAQFSLKKIKTSLLDFQTEEKFNLIYFDAFAPDIQPELWTKEVFEKIFKWLLPGGCLVTYSAKGQVRRNLRGVGFEIEKLPGPHPKREMTRACKPV